jgi:hypothetical protein
MPPRKILYLDSSALTKVYVREPGSRRLAAWIGDRDRGFDPAVRIVVSRLGLPETVSAITRRRNEGTLPAATALRLRNEVVLDFLQPVPPWTILNPVRRVVDRAAFLVMQHRLRGYDAVQLATALRLQMQVGDSAALVFVCSDNGLSKAARAERLTVADPAV